MLRNRVLGLTVALAPMVAATLARGQETRTVEPPMRVLFWFDRSRPLDTFDFRVYDAREGASLIAVDEWLRQVQAYYPRYRAYVKEVARENVASAILREHLATGGPETGVGVRDANGIFGRGGLGNLLDTSGSRRSYDTGRSSSIAAWTVHPGGHVSALGPSPGANYFSSYASSTYSFPVPYIYSRPHP